MSDFSGIQPIEVTSRRNYKFVNLSNSLKRKVFRKFVMLIKFDRGHVPKRFDFFDALQMRGYMRTKF